MRPSESYRFEPSEHVTVLKSILSRMALVKQWDDLDLILRRCQRGQAQLYSKNQLIRGLRWLKDRGEWDAEEAERLVFRLRRKPVRSLSGVAPVTVLTKPWPCPGKCIFCPSDTRMPKSYLPLEPGAQRAAHHRFDPWAQTANRLQTFYSNGHSVDKVELLILGGTFSFYPESYQRWFIKRCFDALNEFEGWKERSELLEDRGIDYSTLGPLDRDSDPEARYNRVVDRFWRDEERKSFHEGEDASWEELETAQRLNEGAKARCVGLTLETRPDNIDEAEVQRLRRLGTTRVQIGYQSLSDEVLELNHRGHDVAATRRAMRLLRHGGFKVLAHWMPNLYGSNAPQDLEDYGKIFSDPSFRPDELKIYPCSLVEDAELMDYWRRGDWQPYTREELVGLLTQCLPATPPYCRLSRVIRDIPGNDIVTGNKTTNLRQVVEKELEDQGLMSRDIRAREIRGEWVDAETLIIRPLLYSTDESQEIFLEAVTPDDRLAGFLRLSLPKGANFIEELQEKAMIREVHVYGTVAGIGQRQESATQHTGLGTRLIEEASRLAQEAGFSTVSVISSVGTRRYYRKLGFEDGDLYQHLKL